MAGSTPLDSAAASWRSAGMESSVARCATCAGAAGEACGGAFGAAEDTAGALFSSEQANAAAATAQNAAAHSTFDMCRHGAAKTRKHNDTTSIALRPGRHLPCLLVRAAPSEPRRLRAFVARR